MFAGNSLEVGFLGAFLNLTMPTGVLMVLRTNNIIRISTVLAHCMCRDRRGANASNLTCLRVSLGKRVSQHEMTLFDFWLTGYRSSIQHHDLPKIDFANLTCALYW